MNRRPWLSWSGWLAVCLGNAVAGQEGPAAGRASVSIELSRPSWFTGQEIAVRVRVEVDDVWFDEHAVPLFPQELDVPLQLLVPWFDELPAAELLPPTKVGGAGNERAEMAVNGAVMAVSRLPDVERAGRTMRAYECERRLLVVEPGELVLAGPQLRFAYATEFVDDIVQGRTALDRHVVEVAGTAAVLRVRPLPASGRPARFGGAVGQFVVRASASPAELELGDQLQLELVIEGDGNLRSLQAPRLDDLPGFHVLGSMDRIAAGRRTVTYDLQPLAIAVREVPVIELPFFDPDPPAAYRVARTQSLPLAVKPRADTDGPDDPGPGPRPPSPSAAFADIVPVGAMPTDRTRRLPAQAILAALLLPWLLAVALWSLRRARSRARSIAAGLDGTIAAFTAAIDRGEADLGRVFSAFLAARLGCTVDGVAAEDLQRALVMAGISRTLALRAARQREKLAKARYAGISTGAAAAALALVEELSAAFDGAGDQS